jgi:hypothetical protein
MSATEDQPFVPKGERAEVPYADDSAAAKEDERTAESEATGKIPASECSTWLLYGRDSVTRRTVVWR